MKSKFYNEEKVKEELEVKKKLDSEQEQRMAFFEKCKKDKRFQKFIVEEILKVNIENLSDNRKIVATGKGKEELADIMIANVKARATLESILNNLL